MLESSIGTHFTKEGMPRMENLASFTADMIYSLWEDLTISKPYHDIFHSGI